MGLSNEKQREYVMRLLQSRTRILLKNPFYGLLLMHVTYGLDESAPTAYTDGERIAFSPTFLEELTDKELDFVMMHEILHIVLRHCKRGNHFEPERYNIAADIVVNSNILYSNNMDLKSITLRKYGESMHLTPKKDEGYDYTAEEVYAMLSSPKARALRDKAAASRAQMEMRVEKAARRLRKEEAARRKAGLTTIPSGRVRTEKTNNRRGKTGLWRTYGRNESRTLPSLSISTKRILRAAKFQGLRSV